MSELTYTFSYQKPSRQIIDICFEVKGNAETELLVRLPFWRPGRYESGNFARNILNLQAESSQGESLFSSKQSKESWLIRAEKNAHIKISYQYYAAELNAGSTYLSADQLYVNPVNCCLFIESRMAEECELILEIPNNYEIASDLPRGESPTRLIASDFDRLADAPFIASSQLQQLSFEISEHLFHLWFMGQVSIPADKVVTDFKAFCAVQLNMMGKLPGNEYHFLFQILPVPFYHGVEHKNSTVCALGPDSLLFTNELYTEFLGVSSHELFHAWNVKTIRPVELSPYDFTRENYSRLGWIYEGITTYYGDQFLILSGVFSEETFFDTFNEKLKKHFVNYGRHNQPVSESSFDTWIDGYVSGVPHRKTSIYTEGSLCAFMLDMLIREHSNEVCSLDDFMRQLYADSKNGRAYNRDRVLQILNGLVEYDFELFFEQYIEGTTDYEPLLMHCLERVGLNLIQRKPFSAIEHAFGFTLAETAGYTTITLIAPNSPAEQAGLMIGDQLIGCNGIRIRANFNRLAENEKTVTIQLFSKERFKEVVLSGNSTTYFTGRAIEKSRSTTPKQVAAFQKWIGKEP
jgi:predicted metalloprotease with PDZ domain